MPVKFQPLPSQAVLHHHFQVAPVYTLGVDSGLIWLRPTSAIRRPGDVAGGLSAHSKQADRRDWKLCFDYTKYYVSRIIYALHHGVDPAEQTVDHIDRNPLNNSIENLQLVDRVTQNRNRRRFKNNTSGIRGVSWSVTRNGWTAQIGQHGKITCLGVFACKVEAAVAYNSALQSLCPDRYEDLKHTLGMVECDCATCKACLHVAQRCRTFRDFQTVRPSPTSRCHFYLIFRVTCPTVLAYYVEDNQAWYLVNNDW